MRIELLSFDGCPNHDRARAELERVLASRGLDPAIVESIRVNPESVDILKFPGSPTIRVNARDVEPGFEDHGSYALSCRLYQTMQGPRGVPDVAWIEHAIDEALDLRR